MKENLLEYLFFCMVIFLGFICMYSWYIYGMVSWDFDTIFYSDVLDLDDGLYIAIKNFNNIYYDSLMIMIKSFFYSIPLFFYLVFSLYFSFIFSCWKNVNPFLFDSWKNFNNNIFCFVFVSFWSFYYYFFTIFGCFLYLSMFYAFLYLFLFFFDIYFSLLLFYLFIVYFAGIFIIEGFEFIGLSIILVYSGSVLVLLLFSFMFLSSKNVDKVYKFEDYTDQFVGYSYFSFFVIYTICMIIVIYFFCDNAIHFFYVGCYMDAYSWSCTNTFQFETSDIMQTAYFLMREFRLALLIFGLLLIVVLIVIVVLFKRK